MNKKLWTREELILAFNLYLKLPFGKMHKNTPEIIELANLLERTPSSIGMRLGNFASCDPHLQARGIGGLTGGMNQVKPIWEEFYNNKEELVFLSERILAERQKTTIERKYKEILYDINNIEGKTAYRQVKTRVNQSVFRTMVLNNYNSTCCITGINQPELLIAGHIRPWGIDDKNRLNPRNGIAINALHDKAIEAGYLTITTDYKVKISPLLMKQNIQYVDDYFRRFDNQPIILPSRFLPDPEFLKYHYKERFKSY